MAEDYERYRLYRELTMCTTEDLRFGYMDADFIRENDEICGILLAREDNMEQNPGIDQNFGIFRMFCTRR